MHLRTTERLLIRHFTRRHLYQWWTGQKHLRPPLHHDHVIGHPRQIRAPRRRASKHDGDRRTSRPRTPRDIAKAAAPGDEDLALYRKIRPRRFDAQNHGKRILARNLSKPRILPQARLAGRPALQRGLVGNDQTLAAADQSDSADDARTRRLTLHPDSCERRDFEKVRTFVEQQLDTLT